MTRQPAPSKDTYSSQRDPFRTLAIIGMILGLILVIGAAVFWALTGRESALIVGAGMTLAIGGGLRNVLIGIVNQIPGYQPPPPDDPPVVKRVAQKKPT